MLLKNILRTLIGQGNDVMATIMSQMSTMVLCLILMHFVSIGVANLPGCEFPPEWPGEWNLEGERDSLQLTIEDFGDRGFCYKQDEEIYVLYSREQDCYRCLTFMDQHPNVLQFREGPCRQLPEGVDDLTSVVDFCSEFSKTTTPLQTLVKLSGTDVECPFSGEFTFNYKKGQESCNSPKSRVEKCMTSTQVAFHFESCPEDNENSKDTFISQLLMETHITGVETLTCKGMWTDDEVKVESEESGEVKTKSVNYLVGLLDEPFLTRPNDKVRCFIYEATPSGGYRIAQSADASCRGLLDVRKHGLRNMHLKPVQVEEDSAVSSLNSCQFPVWATSVGLLHSFALTSQYTFSEDSTSLTMSNYSHLSGEAHTASISKCQRILEQLDGIKYVRLLAKVTAQCETKYKCVNMFGRTEDILEIQEGKLVDLPEDACQPENMDDERTPYTTLISAEAPLRPCTAGGHYNVTELSLKGERDPCTKNGFQQVSIRCKSPELIQFLRECANVIKESEFFCLGGWEETILTTLMDYGSSTSNSQYEPNVNRYDTYGEYTINDGYDQEEPDYLDFPEGNATVGYLIAKPKGKASNAPRRVCIVYTNLNDTYFWTVDPTACPRNIRPGVSGIFKFNTTKQETCGAFSVLHGDHIYQTMAFLWLSLLISSFTGWSRLL